MEGRIPSLLEPKLLAGQLHWLEQRPDQQGRTTLMRRPFGVATDGEGASPPAEELTPGGWNLRSRIHGYGGGACALGLVEGHTIAVFVDDRDRCLWRLDLGPAGAAANEPIQLTQPGPWAFGGGLIDARRQRWIGVAESGGRDQLVAVSLLGGEPLTLHQAADFCGYPSLSPRGSHLAWVEWQQPCLPWQRSQLWLGCFAAAGTDGPGAGLGEGLSACRPVAGSDNGSSKASSVFQPLWMGQPAGPEAPTPIGGAPSPDGAGGSGAPGALPADLLVACDRSGWWNLERLAQAEALTASDLEPSVSADAASARESEASLAPAPPSLAKPNLAWQPLLPMEAEFATPQWVLGPLHHRVGWQPAARRRLRSGELAAGPDRLQKRPYERNGPGPSDPGHSGRPSPARPLDPLRSAF